MANNKLTIDKILHTAWLLFRASLSSTYLYGFGAALLSQLLMLYVLNPAQMISYSSEGQLTLARPWHFIALMLSLLLIAIIANALIMLHLHEHLKGKSQPFIVLWHYLRKRLLYLVPAGIIVNVLTVTGLSFYLVPGLIILAFLYLYMPLILFDRLNMVAAFAKCVQITKEHFMLLFGLTVITLVVTAVPAFASFTASYLLPASAAKLAFGMHEAINIVVSGFAMPLSNALVLMTFLQIKQNKLVN